MVYDIFKHFFYRNEFLTILVTVETDVLSQIVLPVYEGNRSSCYCRCIR